MSEWKEYKLNDISTIVDCEHKTAPTVENSEFISVRTSNISNGKIDFDNCNRVSEKTYTDWSKRMGLVEGDIVLAREAPVGEVGWITKNKKVCLGQRTVLIRADKQKIDSKYLLFFLASNETKYDLISRSTGSVVEHLNVKDIKNFEIRVHSSVKEQRSIASILSSLDNKIDLLHRQNKTLEQLAETLFKQWFASSKKSEVKNEKFGDLVKFIKGKKPNNAIEIFSDGLAPQILIETFDTGKTLYSDPAKMVIANNKDILMVMDGASSGRVDIGISGIVGSTIGLFRPTKDFNYSLFLFYFLKSNEEFITDNTTGSAIPHTDRALVLNLDVECTSIEKVREFEQIAENYFNKKLSNKNQIRTLTQLRDTLLPKLMSGEVKVSYL